MYYSLTGEQMRHIYILKGRALDPPLLYKWSEALVRCSPVGGGAVDVSLVIRACKYIYVSDLTIPGCWLMCGLSMYP